MVEIKKQDNIMERYVVEVVLDPQARILLDRIARALEEMNRGVKVAR